jgi:hypothetical protein
MAEVAKEVMGQFPIDELCFIFASGLFILLAFPFDIFSFDFSSPVAFDIGEFSKWVYSSFAPFANLKYVGWQFPTYLAMLFFASLPLGVIMYLLFGVYERSNHFIMSSIGRVFGTTPKELFCNEHKFDGAPMHVKLEFYLWLKEKGVNRFMTLLWSMRSISTGLLYGSETFSLLVILSLLLGARTSILEWLGFSVILVLFFYFCFVAFQKRSNDLVDVLFTTFSSRWEGHCYWV